ncbi:MAG: 2'-5' RNA ligase family protein [Bacteroidia bacterium]
MQFHLQFESDIAEQDVKLVTYKIMIHPGDKVTEDAKSFKKILFDNCGKYDSVNSPPHITIASFSMDEQREDILVKQLDKFTSSASPFSVSVNNFNFFDTVQGHGVAYLSIQNKEPIIQLQTLINIVLKIDVRVNKKYLLKTKVPHITIGKNLDKTKLEKSKEIFSGKEYSSNFTVDKIVLLKQQSQNKYHEVCKEFYFF